MRFRKTQLPGQTRVLNARARARAGAAVVAGDQNHVRAALGNARGNGADAGLRNELDVDPRVRIGVLEIEDQLRQILNRIDVVMRGRGDEPHAGCRVPRPRDLRIDLAAGQLAAFAGLRTLRHLDLNLLGGG